MADNVQGTVYLIHLDRPFGHAKHYRGWSQFLEARLEHHRRGTGATFLRHVKEAGIGWQLAMTFPGTRHDERRFKNRGGASRLCPICNP